MSARYGPVDVPGFTLQRPLGSGGYADVFLYEQHLPRRLVAVKIMHEPVDDPAARARFESEANLMAALSTHPSIVTIHHAAVADNGRPYLVMEYCSRPTLAETYPHRTVSVPELLQTLVRLCGAVETAHRAGILHRDIKPANVLTTDYGWPALTDFGLSSLAGAAADAAGVSVPWAAPELVSGRGFDARSDVYALAATAYTVLAGRTPFEDPRARTDLTAHVTRVLTEAVPPIGRDDVPIALERLIITALAKDPDRRSQTASEFARTLQRIEQDLHLPVTNLDIPALAPTAAPPMPPAIDDADLPERTRLVTRRSPEPAPDDHTLLSSRPPAAAQQPSDADAAPGAVAADDHTLLSSRATAGTGDEAPPPADATLLAARRSGVPTEPARQTDDEHTRLAARRSAPAGADAPPAAADDADDEHTQLAARRSGAAGDRDAPATDPLAAAPSPGRTARDPAAEAAREAYGIRSSPVVAPVVRSAPAPATPVPTAAATEPRRPARGRRVAIAAIAIGATVAVIAAAIAGIGVLVGL
ncbi:protein kinase [Microbacterium sp. zg-Y818]|uniref:serine/threonine-protein kinase n=1 Tax=unclassified Microbacterium TaxID=2609290 RepID=UPI00214C710E|nr:MULTISPECIES: serine/threonine-protein kinase [unclassified Microbacterium]MCR2801435.1 protein kinase [Microbacterium sp. zg.Y818]WIM21255.1 protein kinase [Microbacterium sp. zg-Y818]